MDVNSNVFAIMYFFSESNRREYKKCERDGERKNCDIIILITCEIFFKANPYTILCKC